MRCLIFVCGSGYLRRTPLGHYSCCPVYGGLIKFVRCFASHGQIKNFLFLFISTKERKGQDTSPTGLRRFGVLQKRSDRLRADTCTRTSQINTDTTLAYQIFIFAYLRRALKNNSAASQVTVRKNNCIKSLTIIFFDRDSYCHGQKKIIVQGTTL